MNDIATLKDAAQYPTEPVLAWKDPMTGWEFGYLIPLEDQWAYDCEGCGSEERRAVVVWGPDRIANCVQCTVEDESGDCPVLALHALPCAYHAGQPVTAAALVLHGDRLNPACTFHVAQYESSPTQATDPDSHISEKRVVRL